MKWTIKPQNNGNNKSMHSFIKQYFKKNYLLLVLYAYVHQSKAIDQ